MERVFGLVLEGGGAKGAFEFGIIKVLHKAGLRFHAVSGTSVGALNAVILATDSVDEGHEIWNNLTFGKVFRRNHPRALAWLAGTIIFITQIFRSLAAPPIPASGLRIAKFALVFALTVPVLAVQLVVPAEAGWQRVLGFVVSIMGGAFIASSAADADSDVSVGSPNGRALFYLFLPWIFVALALVAAALARWGLLAAIVLVTTMYFAVKTARKTTHDSTPLKTVLQEFLRRPLRSKIFVASAHKASLWIPDRIDSMNRTLAGASVPVRKHYSEYAPTYHNLNEIDEEARVLAALASASLPLGLVEGVQINGTRHVDGGVADNCPLYPLLDLGECTDVIVIHLSTEAESRKESPWARSGTDDIPVWEIQPTCDRNRHLIWDRFNRLEHLIRYCAVHPCPRDLTTTVPTETFRPPRRPPRFPNVHPVYPAKSLGGFFDGTLNFSESKARELITAGEARGHELLAELGIGPASA